MAPPKGQKISPLRPYYIPQFGGATVRDAKCKKYPFWTPRKLAPIVRCGHFSPKLEGSDSWHLICSGYSSQFKEFP